MLAKRSRDKVEQTNILKDALQVSFGVTWPCSNGKENASIHVNTFFPVL